MSDAIDLIAVLKATMKEQIDMIPVAMFFNITVDLLSFNNKYEHCFTPFISNEKNHTNALMKEIRARRSFHKEVFATRTLSIKYTMDKKRSDEKRRECAIMDRISSPFLLKKNGQIIKQNVADNVLKL